MDFSRFEALTFDCYGTLVDWESGILAALRPILIAHGQNLSDGQILELHSELEPAEQQKQYKPYREVLEGVVRGFGRKLGFAASSSEVSSLPTSLQNWKPFPDTVPALESLKTKFKLAIISNTDDDLFEATACYLKITFDEVITAQQARAYKPALEPFKIAMQRLGLGPDRLVHVGQSVYHDVVPAKSLGIKSVWVNRRPGQQSAVKSADVKPDIEVPDMQTLARIALNSEAASPAEKKLVGYAMRRRSR